MDVIIEFVNTHTTGVWTVVIVFLLSCVEVSKIKINPISTVLAFIGKKCNADLYERMDAFEERQTELSDRFEGVKGVMQDRFQEIDIAMDTRFSELNDKVNGLINRRDFDEAMTSRYRLIRAADEILEGHKISDDHLQQLGEDIEIYNTYCLSHPDYKNHKGKKSMQIVTDYENEKRKGGVLA